MLSGYDLLMPSKRATAVAVAFAALFPTVVTWVYFDLLQDSPLKMIAYPLGKVLQFAFPLFWVGWVLKQRFKHGGIAQLDTQPVLRLGASLLFGTLMGIGVAVAMWGIFRFFPVEIVEALAAEVSGRVSGFSVDSVEKFIGLALFYSVVHSLMEEYYFRWFVFGQLRSLVAVVPAAIISGLAFMAHHVLVLNHFFPDEPGWTAFLSLSIAVGGVIWAVQYEKSKSLLGPWLSHAIVDAGIFALGYRLMYQ